MSTQDSSASNKPLKRYQECPWYERLWRRRHYLRIPLLALSIYRHGSDKESSWRLTFKLSWSIATGLVQAKNMRWWYTPEEVEERLGLGER